MGTLPQIIAVVCTVIAILRYIAMARKYHPHPMGYWRSGKYDLGRRIDAMPEDAAHRRILP